jgi:hypothetical protein
MGISISEHTASIFRGKGYFQVKHQITRLHIPSSILPYQECIRLRGQKHLAKTLCKEHNLSPHSEVMCNLSDRH